MIGSRIKTNDLYIFLENDELHNLYDSKIIGTFVNFRDQDNLGKLEISINEEICRKNMETVFTETETKDNGLISSMKIFLRPSVYERINDRGIYVAHQGFRHIDIIDSSKEMSFNDKIVFEGLINTRKVYNK